MPNYDYVCECCSHEETQLRKIKDRDDERACKHCGDCRMVRQLATPLFKIADGGTGALSAPRKKAS